jgi:tetratricopeptide (TPR) repeat protein
LIVLEAVADYVRYDITPPVELRGDFEKLKAQMGTQQAASRGQHLESVARRFNAEIEWWKREFPKDGRPQPPVAKINEGVTQLNANDPRAKLARRSPATAAAPSPMAMLPAQMAPASVADRLEARSDSSANSSSNSSAIQLQKWTPDAAYARRLRAAKTDNLYAVYLDEKPSHQNSTAFFLDVSDLLLERGQTELALRVLSNLAEMNLENRHILRILGYRLLQAKQYALAISVLEKVRTLSPEEPQSWRDLGLAYAQDGRPQEAIDALWEVVSRRWDGRFPDIELIAQNELNAMASRAKVAGQRVDVSAIDSRLLRNLPLDLRAALTWDADNTDIDLHVTDPDGETAFFGRPLTWQGARVSRDFTRGYGPEVFSLRNAKPGVYTVRAQFYGHTQQIVAPATTLMLQLSTGFGTEQQVDQAITLRLNGRGDMVTVGTFEVKAPAK